jgi:glycosyltransferase involved in cell wall biosynthesis
MIVRDEEAVLGRCLDSVRQLADEIILVDTGSEDGTKEIAARFTPYIYEYPWQDDFSAARNFSFSKANGEYILWLDADDVVPRRSLELLMETKKQMDSNIDILMLPYQTAFDEAGNSLLTYERERIVRNGPFSVWSGAVHEVIVPYGRIEHVNAPILHKKIKSGDENRNLRIYEKFLAQKGVLDDRQKYYYGRELYAHGRYEEAEKIFRDIVETPEVWIENRIEASRLLAYCKYELGREEEALEALIRSLAWAEPRAETCCDIGRHLYDRNNYKAAIFWYQAALSLKKHPERGGFVEEDCYGFLPCIQLCLCYDRLGDYDRAEYYNEEAGKYKPWSEYYLQNKEYFRKKTIPSIQSKKSYPEKEKNR